MDPIITAGERLLDYNHSRLVAVLDSCTAAQEAAAELSAAGFTQSFDVHCGTAGARLIDFDGTQHGPLARTSHALHHLTVEGEHMHHYTSVSSRRGIASSWSGREVLTNGIELWRL